MVQFSSIPTLPKQRSISGQPFCAFGLIALSIFSLCLFHHSFPFCSFSLFFFLCAIFCQSPKPAYLMQIIMMERVLLRWRKQSPKKVWLKCNSATKFKFTIFSGTCWFSQFLCPCSCRCPCCQVVGVQWKSSCRQLLFVERQGSCLLWAEWRLGLHVEPGGKW